MITFTDSIVKLSHHPIMTTITLKKIIQAWVVAISSDNEVVVLRSIFCDVRILLFDFIPTQRLNDSTTQHLYSKYFHHLLVPGF